MKIVNLVVNSINNKKTKNMSCRVKSNNEVIVTFYLPIPASTSDVDLITSENTFVIYKSNKKQNFKRYEVGLYNIKDPYPPVSKSKVFAVQRTYCIDSWINLNPGFFSYLNTQREEIFREVKCNILLNKIGVLSKQWEHISSGKPSYSVDKPLEPYSNSVPRRINDSIKSVSYGGSLVDEELPF